MTYRLLSFVTALVLVSCLAPPGAAGQTTSGVTNATAPPRLADGTIARGRTSATEVTIFKSLGMAVEDVAAVHLTYTRARQQSHGTEIAL